MIWLEVILFDNFLDLSVAEDASFTAASTFSSTALEATPGLAASRVFELETTAVEAQAHVELVSWDVVTPEKVEGEPHFRQVGMAIDVRADGIVTIPNTMQAGFD